MKPVFFAKAAAFRDWLEAHRTGAAELLVGFYRRDTGRDGLTYPAALDEALCFGWIDGLRKRRDATSYTIRFTPRKTGSIWSRANIAHAERLIAAGKMQPAGLAAFAARRADRSGVYSFENRPRELPRAFATLFRANPKAWSFWQSQPPGYRRTATWWAVSAKQEPTRLRRLEALIATSASGRRIDFMKPPPTRRKK
jgi:uncharacterized protein YdeI (YjbR/CyaY-like superfamily)